MTAPLVSKAEAQKASKAFKAKKAQEAKNYARKMLVQMLNRGTIREQHRWWRRYQEALRRVYAAARSGDPEAQDYDEQMALVAADEADEARTGK